MTRPSSSSAVRWDGAGSSGSYKEYGMDANGSVEGLEDDDGTIRAGNQYQYDPYGKVENEAEIEEAGGPGNAAGSGTVLRARAYRRV